MTRNNNPLILELSEYDITRPAVAKINHNTVLDLKLENDGLKETIVELQEGFENLRGKYNQIEVRNEGLKTENKFLLEKGRGNVILDLLIFGITLSIAFFTNLITNNPNNLYYWFIGIILALIQIGIITYRHVNSQNNKPGKK